MAVVFVAVAAVIVAALVVGIPWDRLLAPGPESAEAPAAAPAPEQQAPPPVPATSPTDPGDQPSRPARGPLRPLEVQLVTVRPVWIRAVVDGRTLLADTVRADETITLSANTAVLVRIGDAGAVRLSVNGDDRGPAGRDGQVLTTRFDARSPSGVRPPGPQ